jgi:very-short-patch-repair endonuclease
MLAHMTTDMTRRAVRLAGIVTTADLRAARRSPGDIRRMVRRRDLFRLRRGLFVTAELASSLQQLRIGENLLAGAAAADSLGPIAVVSHHSAAQIHELDLLLPPPARVAITRPPGRRRSSDMPGVLVHSAALPAGHIGSRFFVPVTTVARTVVDLARTLSFREGVVVADSALHQKLTSKKELHAVLAECPRWPGIQQARAVVEFADRLAESVLESIARVVFRDCGLPAPELQVEVSHDGVRYRVDFMWKQYRTVAEVDGKLKYEDRSRFGYERRRDVWLRNAGFEVVHFTWQEITTQPEYVAATLLAAFRRGSQHARAG